MKTVRSVDILLPDAVPFEKWAVVSCDQFTSQRGYWKELSDFVGTSPSTLKLIFPEVYLNDGGADERIESINRTMSLYLKEGIFKTLQNSFVLVKRDTAFGASRLGLVIAVDLEDYSFVHPNNAVIRSTEGVVTDRIPPRLKIRTDAPIELPHIILLIDDRKKTVIEPLFEDRANLEKLYDFDLNMNGGHLTGWRVDAGRVLKSFDEYEKSIGNAYGIETDFVFAVGDGNHSLATAQAHWNNVKKTLTDAEKENHPARFALCEVENLHDEGVTFEPIHRFVFGADDADFVSYMSGKLSGEGSVRIFTRALSYTLHAPANGPEAIAAVQSGIDGFLAENPEAKVDYIHGLEHLEKIADESEGVAVEMPAIKKEELFSYVLSHGTLSRKAFSMGEAEEKRYYMEAKRIR